MLMFLVLKVLLSMYRVPTDCGGIVSAPPYAVAIASHLHHTHITEIAEEALFVIMPLVEGLGDESLTHTSFVLTKSSHRYHIVITCF